MKSFRKFYSYINILSLDVVLGAIAGMLFFAHVLGLTMNEGIVLILGLTVWIVYTLDHLIDVKKFNSPPNSPRHRFHVDNKKPLQRAVGIALLVGLMLLGFLPSLHFIIIPGIILAFIIACSLGFIYFFGKKIAFMKEFLIALFYVSGIVLAPYSLYEKTIPVVFYFLVGLYFLLAWINLLILSYLDKESDQKDGFDSVINWIGPNNLKALVLTLAIIANVFSLYLFLSQMSYYHIYTSILLLMILIHVIYFLNNQKDKEWLRKVLEASFLLPFLLFLF